LALSGYRIDVYSWPDQAVSYLIVGPA